MRTTLPVILCLTLVSTSVAAQEIEKARGEVDYTFEVFGILGLGRLGADEGSRGSGPVLGGGVGFRPTASGLGVEVEAGVLSNSRTFTSGVRFEGTAVLVSGNVLYHFSASRNQVYVIGGLGMLRSVQRSEFRDAIFADTQTFRSTETFAVWNAGVGLKMFLMPNLVARPEIRYFGAESLGVLGMPRASVALGYYW